MPITGSQPALMYALGGVARGGATRGGYYSPSLFLSVGGVQVGTTSRADADATVLVDSLSITDVNGASANTCSFTARGWTPTVGQEVVITLGSINTLTRLFAGLILSVEQVYLADKPANVAYLVSAIDYSWLLNRRKVIKRYQSQTATEIATDLIGSFTTGFTTDHVATGLDQLDEITFTNQDVSEALTHLADRIGEQWKVDYHRDLHFPSDDDSLTPPTDLTSTHASLANVAVQRDASQMRTRIWVEGGGANAAAPVSVGATVLPVEDATWYSDTGGLVQSGPQRVSYTGKVAGGAGALVGTTVVPTNGPTAIAATGTGVDTGDHQYKQTFVTGAGETLPSPASATVTTGSTIAAPTSAPVAAKQLGGSLSAGAYQWQVTFVDSAGGETTTSSASASVTMDDVTAPSAIGTASTSTHGGAQDVGGSYSYKYTFVNGSYETLPSPASNSYTCGATGAGQMARSGVQSPPPGFERQFYRTEGGGSTYLKMSGASDGFYADDASLYYDGLSDASLGVAAPGSATALYRSAAVTIPISANPNVVSRKLYRTVANGSTFKLVATIANNTQTSYTDTTADGSLGATAPTSNTAVLSRVSVSSIAVGPTGTTSRKLYRTAVGGTVFKLVTTIADNTTTTYTDSTADSGLGAAAPTSDTSGLVSQTGEVAAGSTSVAVTSTAPFSSTGGWASIGALRIRYTGVSGTALTGVPPSGDGALGTTVRYGVEVVAAPMLTGIPASGTGAVQYPILAGDEVNVLAQVDDLDAQALLASLVGGDGIQEDYLQDRRLSLAEATARGEAELARRNQVDVRITYTARDVNTRAGRTVTVNLGAPTNVSGDFIIQRVTIGGFGVPRLYPTYRVEAAPDVFSLVDLLRLGVEA